jgi:hypothetical protein
MKGFITSEVTYPSGTHNSVEKVTESVLPQVIAFITLMMKGLITSSQFVDSGAVVVKSAALGERPQWLAIHFGDI